MVTVVVRLAFDLAPGIARLSARAQPPTAGDEHFGGSRSRSVFQPSDLAPYKPRSDIMVSGHAYASNRAPVPRIRARVRVGSVDKTVLVTSPTSPASGVGPDIVRGSLSYEHAARGDANPVGVLPGATDPMGGNVVPSVMVETQHARGGTSGLGPIAPTWHPRRSQMQSGLEAWLDAWPPTVAWPRDDDGRFFNAAADDQQLDAPLAPDERIYLENLHRDHPVLDTRLPGARARGFVRWPSGQVTELLLRADTLWIDTDRGLATVTYRGAFPVGAAAGNLQVATMVERLLGVSLSGVPDDATDALAIAIGSAYRAAAEPRIATG